MTHNQVGELGERLAEEYLRRNCFQIVGRNYQDGTGLNCRGEIDLIALKDETLYFVEVKCRSNSSTFGDFSPEAALTPQKIKRIKKAAQSFIAQNHPPFDVAFSLVAINLIQGQKPQIRHYENIRI